MPTNAKWTRNSGPATNRNVGATRLKGDGGQIKTVELVNGNVYNGYSLNIEGSNLVLGLGTSTPFSRLSFGNNTNSGYYDINDTGQLSSIALNETSSGGKFSGLFFSSDIKKYYQPIGLTDISTNGIQIMTTDLNSFNTTDTTGGLLFITNENVTTIGGQPRVGINEGNITENWRGIDIGDNPNNYANTARDGQTKVVLDVRGSIRTDGYINFFHKYYDNNVAKFAPAPAFWLLKNENIPIGSLWLQPTAGVRGEGLWFKNSSGVVLRVEATTTGVSSSIDRNDAISLDMFNFLFDSDDYLNTATNPAGGHKQPGVKFPYIILKGKGSGQGGLGMVGGTALNIRGHSSTQLMDITHEKGYNESGSNEREIFSITQGNLTVTGLSGEEFLIKTHNVMSIPDDVISPLIHPMKTFYDHHGLLQTDMSGGKIWCERQLLIGPKKADINWALIDVQTTPNSPTLLSYNLDKNWSYNTNADKRNRRFITQRATNSIILLNKKQDHQGHTSDNCSVGELYDCSNSIIIGDVFKNLDVPKSLIINVNSSRESTLGQEIYDDIGGNIISGHKNQIYKSPYCFVIGEENFIQNNTNTVLEIDEDDNHVNGLGSNIISGKKNEIWAGIYNFITGYYNRNQGNYNRIGGTNNIIGFYSEDKNGNPINPTSKRGSSSDDFNKRHFNNTIFGSYNCIGLQTIETSGSGVNTAFISGHSNTIEEYSTEGNKIAPIALGSQAYVGGDIRFAIGVYDNTPSINSKATLTNHSNKFVIDKNGNVGIGTSSPSFPLTVRQEDYNNDGTAEDIPERTPQIVIETDGYKGALEFRSKWSSYNYGGAMIYTTQHGDKDTNLHLVAAQDSVYPEVPGITIDSYNNVGIGTTSPKSKLDVEGDTLIQGDIHIGTVPTLTPQAARWLYFDNIDEFGNLFGWNGATTIGGIIFRGNEPSDYTVGTLPNFENYCKIDADAATGGGGTLRGDIKFWTRNSGGGGGDGSGMFERMRIRYDGNVGIGTTSPDAKLEIAAAVSTEASTYPFLRLTPNNTTNSSGLTSIFLGTHANNNYGISLSSWRKESNSSPYFAINTHKGSSSGETRFLLDKDGNVGIGTPSPGYKLEVAGDISGVNIYGVEIHGIFKGNADSATKANISLTSSPDTHYLTMVTGDSPQPIQRTSTLHYRHGWYKTLTVGNGCLFSNDSTDAYFSNDPWRANPTRDYALRQSGNTATYLNAPLGGQVHFAIANITRASLNTAGDFNFNNNVTVQKDLTVQDLTVEEDLTVQNDLTVQKDLTVNISLHVNVLESLTPTATIQIKRGGVVAVEINDDIEFNKAITKVDLPELGAGVSGPLLAVGLICMWVSPTLPSNWMWCAGGAFNKSNYPSLFEHLKGAGMGVVGAGTVNEATVVPDMTDRYPRAGEAGGGIFETGGGEEITKVNLPDLTHNHGEVTLASRKTQQTQHSHVVAAKATTSNGGNHSHQVPGRTTDGQGQHNHVMEEVNSNSGTDEYGVIPGTEGGSDSGACLENGYHSHYIPEHDTAKVTPNHTHQVPQHSTNQTSHDHQIPAFNIDTLDDDIGTSGSTQPFKPKFFRTNFIIYCGPQGT